MAGIDREPSQVEAARSWAAEKGIHNVRFETGCSCEIPYPDVFFALMQCAAAAWAS